MSKKDKYLVGLDIGSTKTCVLIAELADELAQAAADCARERVDALQERDFQAGHRHLAGQGDVAAGDRVLNALERRDEGFHERGHEADHRA